MNDVLGWVWLFLGVFSGLLLGLGFLKPGFLGGYDSPRRRLVRLGHISFFGMGILNILFTMRFVHGVHGAAMIEGGTRVMGVSLIEVAAWGFVVAGITMPLVCGLTAWKQTFHALFCVPVLSALIATGICAWEVVR